VGAVDGADERVGDHRRPAKAEEVGEGREIKYLLPPAEGGKPLDLEEKEVNPVDVKAFADLGEPRFGSRSSPAWSAM